MRKASPHIPFAQLLDLHDGQLPPEKQTNLRRHLGTCRTCAADLAALERAITIMRRDTSVDAPPDVIARAVRLFGTTRAASPGRPRRILATLRFDSAQPTPALAVRAATWPVRQRLYHAEAYELDLRETPTDGLWTVKGQVLGPCTGGLVELRGPLRAVQSTLDELCTFTLPPVPADIYTLTLRLPEIEVELPSLQIGG
jgi:hypothetical protein